MSVDAAQETCACGQPLHYSQPANQAIVQRLIDMHGPLLIVRTPQGAWWVPRHWIALHGIAAADLPALAAQYGWDTA